MLNYNCDKDNGSDLDQVGDGEVGRRDSSSLRRSKAIWELTEEQELLWGKGREKHSRQKVHNVQIWPGGKECGEDLKNKVRWKAGVTQIWQIQIH